jgi:hypothetical protein
MAESTYEKRDEEVIAAWVIEETRDSRGLMQALDPTSFQEILEEFLELVGQRLNKANQEYKKYFRENEVVITAHLKRMHRVNSRRALLQDYKKKAHLLDEELRGHVYAMRGYICAELKAVQKKLG